MKQAYCSSHRCYPDGTGSKGVKKPNLQENILNCPDCGSALLWTGKRNISNFVSRLKKNNYKRESI
jgi:hypothetical protein